MGAAVVALLITSACADAPSYDLLLEGGTVVDGTGRPSRAADVAIRNGRIVAIARPARWLGIADRGALADGSATDVVIFDAAMIMDRSTYLEPHQYPDGVRHVIVNGNSNSKGRPP